LRDVLCERTRLDELSVRTDDHRPFRRKVFLGDFDTFRSLFLVSLVKLYYICKIRMTHTFQNVLVDSLVTQWF
jgi:hypothetical protein